MVHENDPQRGGCEFARFFQTTPEDLLADGIFKDLAIAFYPGPHRDVSSALFAKAIGGKIGNKSSFAHLLRRVDAARRESL